MSNKPFPLNPGDEVTITAFVYDVPDQEDEPETAEYTFTIDTGRGEEFVSLRIAAVAEHVRRQP